MTNFIAFGIVNSNSAIPISGKSITQANIGFGIEKNGGSDDGIVFVDIGDHSVGWGDVIKNNSTLCIQIDLKSEEKEKRTIHFIVNNKQQECFFYNVPQNVKISLKGKNDSVEILSVSEIRERITKDLKYEQGYDWNEDFKQVKEKESFKQSSMECCIC